MHKEQVRHNEVSENFFASAIGFLSTIAKNTGNIQVSSKEDNVKFYSDSLKWNAKTEQLTSGKSNTVKIEKDDATIYGSGFSASGVSKSFSFSGSVSGEIITKDNSENDTDETIEEKYE